MNLVYSNGGHTMPVQAVEVAANESNEPNKAKLELKIDHLIRGTNLDMLNLKYSKVK